MKLEVEWKAKPSTGLSYIDIDELGYNEKEWSALDKEQQKIKINQWLLENDEEIVPMAVNWEVE